jgi:hypothetical protein
MAINLPVTPTLEDLTKEQLLDFLHKEIGIESVHSETIAAYLWREAATKNTEAKNEIIAARYKIIEGKDKARGVGSINDYMALDAQMQELDKQWDELSAETDALSEYFRIAVMGEKATPVQSRILELAGYEPDEVTP